MKTKRKYDQNKKYIKISGFKYFETVTLSSGSSIIAFTYQRQSINQGCIGNKWVNTSKLLCKLIETDEFWRLP